MGGFIFSILPYTYVTPKSKKYRFRIWMKHVHYLFKVPIINLKKWQKKNTLCNICNENVTNFERHLARNHKEHRNVVEMLSFPKGSKERRQIIDCLRKEGHFNEFLRGNLKPAYCSKQMGTTKCYPCVNCKGLYSQKYLHRHQKNVLLHY